MALMTSRRVGEIIALRWEQLISKQKPCKSSVAKITPKSSGI
jgi:hypothetical protein